MKVFIHSTFNITHVCMHTRPYVHAHSTFNIWNGYNEIEHLTDMINYPNYFPNYDPDLHTETFRPISSIESRYRISKFPDSFDTNSLPNECSQVGSEQVFENQSVSESLTPKVIRVDAIIISRSVILPYDMPKGP